MSIRRHDEDHIANASPEMLRTLAEVACNPTQTHINAYNILKDAGFNLKNDRQAWELVKEARESIKEFNSKKYKTIPEIPRQEFKQVDLIEAYKDFKEIISSNIPATMKSKLIRELKIIGLTFLTGIILLIFCNLWDSMDDEKNIVIFLLPYLLVILYRLFKYTVKLVNTP